MNNSVELQNNDEGAACIVYLYKRYDMNHRLLPEQETTNDHFMLILGRRYVLLYLRIYIHVTTQNLVISFAPTYMYV